LPKIAFSDSSDPRIIEATKQIAASGIAQPVLISEKPVEKDKERLAGFLLEKQKKNNLTHDDVLKQLNDPLYQGIGYLLAGDVDGLIAGSTRPTADVVKAAIQCIGVGSKERFIAGHFLIETESRASADNTPILFADCAVMPEPSVRALAAIALGAAHSYQFFTGKPPRVALLSFSTRGSAVHPLVDRLKEAVEIIRKQDPSLLVDGDLQVDAALDPDVALIKKAGDSQVAGKANVFVFPTLEAGNIGYKLVQRFSNARIAGPLLWGLGKPVSDLSRGCTVQEVTDTALCVSAMIGKA
jgi:phosphate acetyltransferase